MDIFISMEEGVYEYFKFLEIKVFSTFTISCNEVNN